MSTKRVRERTRNSKRVSSKHNKSSSRGKTEILLEKGRRAYMEGNFESAKSFWLPLAELGNSDAQAWIGSLYANGDGVEVDDYKAFEWYVKSASGGNVQAQSNVGAMYAMGNGVDKDSDQAIIWFEKASDEGDPNAQFNLAVLLSNDSHGITKDLERAVRLYRSAAEKGHYPSQARLGHMYSIGQGVKKDRIQAYVWLSLAAQHGIGTALNALEAVANQMSSEEKAEALTLFDAWRGKTSAAVGPSRIEPLPG